MKKTGNGIEIYFDDFNEDAKKEFLEAMGIDTDSEGNYDTFPIAIVPLPEIEEKDEIDFGNKLKWKKKILDNMIEWRLLLEGDELASIISTKKDENYWTIKIECKKINFFATQDMEKGLVDRFESRMKKFIKDEVGKGWKGGKYRKDMKNKK